LELSHFRIGVALTPRAMQGLRLGSSAACCSTSLSQFCGGQDVVARQNSVVGPLRRDFGLQSSARAATFLANGANCKYKKGRGLGSLMAAVAGSVLQPQTAAEEEDEVRFIAAIRMVSLVVCGHYQLF